MLQSIRDRTQGWIAGVIISLLILSFALWGIHSYVGGGGGSLTVAKVNGVEISKGQLAVAYERLRRQLQAQFNSSYELPEHAEAALKDKALQTLVNIQVLKQASLSQDYRISSNQVDGFLESMPEFQVNGQFSDSRFQQVLETTLYSAADFLDLIKTSLLIDQPRLGLIFTSFALPDEIENSVALINQERSIKYAVLPIQAAAKQSIQIPEDKIQAYYDQHKDEFKTPEQVSIDYVELSLKNLMANIHPTDEAVMKFYKENSSSFTQPVQWKLDGILIPLTENASADEIKKAQDKTSAVMQKANAGTDFAALMKEFALEKAGNKIPEWATINQIPAELQDAVLGLTKAGQVSNPVRTVNGIVLFKAVGMKEAVVKPFAEVKDKVKETLVHQQAEEKFADLREKLGNVTYEHPDSLEPAVKSLGLTLTTSELFTKDKGSKGIASSSKVREAAFSNDVLNLRNNSDLIQTGFDGALVLRIKTHAPATLLPLKTVEKQITDKLQVVELEARVAKQADEIRQKLQSGMTVQQAAQNYHLTWLDTGFIGRQSTKVNAGILNTAFGLPNPKEVKQTASYAIAKVSDGYAVVVLQDVRDGVVDTKNHEKYQVFAEQIQNTQGLMEYELYKQSQMNQAKIETD